jgi:hypothetical protein
MPGFICPRHGNTYKALVCPHIKEDISSVQLPERTIILVFNFGEFQGTPVRSGYCYCSICAEQNDLPVKDTELLRNDESFDEKFESLPDIFIPVCADCFREAEEKGGIAIGADLPSRN